MSEAQVKVAQAISLRRDLQSRPTTVCTGVVVDVPASPRRNEFRLQADSRRHLRTACVMEARS